MVATDGDPHAEPEALVTVREAAQLVGVTPDTMWRWLQRGLLPAQPSTQGRLVSPAAVRAVAAALGHPTEGVLDGYVPPFVANRQFGLNAMQVRRWAYTGKVASKPGRYGQLVRLVDVQALAEAHASEHQPDASSEGRGVALGADDPRDLVTVDEAAQLAGVSPVTVQRWVARGYVPTQPHTHGRLVSLVAVRALAAAGVARACPSAAPRELPDDDAEYVLPSIAARATDVPLYTVRYWQRTGKVASRPSRYGRQARLADVQALAAQWQGAAPRPADESSNGERDEHAAQE
jgi:DNA-binding transcriptional MerR regulator